MSALPTPISTAVPASAEPGSLTSYCQAVADGTVAPTPGVRGLWRKTLCLLVRTHHAGVPF